MYVANICTSPVAIPPRNAAKQANTGANTNTENPLYAKYISKIKDKIIPITPITIILFSPL